MSTRQQRTISVQDWLTEGEKLCGPDRSTWRFICPCCGHVQTPAEMEAAGGSRETAFYSCIGRWVGAKREAFGKGPGPCNYAGGGLIGLNPVRLLGPDGQTHDVFEFATQPAAEAVAS